MNELENSAIKHQIYFEKYKNGCANEIMSLLDKANKDISFYIKQTHDISTKKRYLEISRKIKDIAKSLRENVDNKTDVDSVIRYELKKQKKILDSVKDQIKKIKGGNVNFLYPSFEQIKTAVVFKPAGDSLTYQSYLNGIEAGLYNVWDSAVRTGYLVGIPTKDIVDNVVGSVSKTAQLTNPGSINALRNSVWSNTRTLLQSFASETRNKIFEENEKYFGDNSTNFKYEYLSTLDARSCLVCANDDGHLFKSLRECPSIPRHRGCRCLVIPYLGYIDGESRSSEYGYVSDKVTFGSWLKKQNDAVKKEILGESRLKMYKEGKSITSFVENGRILTIKELNEKLKDEE